jgi:hypothetical protein
MNTKGKLYRSENNNLAGGGDLILLPKNKKLPNLNENVTELVNSSLNAPAQMKQYTTEYDHNDNLVPGINYVYNLTPNSTTDP